MIILGIDPSIVKTGWAVIGDGDELVALGTVRTKPSEDGVGVFFGRRLHHLCEDIRVVIEVQKPTHVVIEQHPHFSFKKATSASGKQLGLKPLIALHKIVGALEYLLFNMGFDESNTAKPFPADYKGSMPAKMVKMNMGFLYPTFTINEDEAHAILMALWYKGRLQRGE